MQEAEESPSAVIKIAHDDDAEMFDMPPERSARVEHVTSENWHRRHRDVRTKANLPIEGEDAEGINDEEEIDDFADKQYTGWRAAAKDILYLLYYDPDASDFTYPLNEKTLG